ncbi:hypothetical protein MPTK1_7g15530 [Marchantia polymorpha subsp. ruderalis]|uniref:Protein kinase domain-containing protein n=2 Tax=Marchantia polymorpha TaxID=3197 RepID=A0AAF6BZZ9_MARPO|nr:hypothetical protein MARPO_0009s0237 [Marchantia polymorpha]BBN17583.1 hypothetical protein Mp_7g15530 [Marchantia polymorpha subsp. ruderalis]|eukprot:PTQ47190.1 hypothetical protein MARPO_0009s0237 [Marchantia polymorpha]
MGTHMSRAVRAHDSSQSLRSLNFNKQEDSSVKNKSNTMKHHSSSEELDSMPDENEHSHHSTHSNQSHRSTPSSRDTPQKPMHRNHSFGDIHLMRNAAKHNNMPRNSSYGDVRKHRHHHDLHSVSKRFQQVLGRSESFRESREIQAITFKKDFQTHYSCDLRSPLSHGRYATVTAALSYLTAENVAVKIISKDRLRSKGVPAPRANAHERTMRTAILNGIKSCSWLYDKKSGRRCAGENVRVEVLALRNLANQPNVVKFVDVFEDEAFFYLVMELCKGGNLLERINKVKNMKEAQAGPLLKQMLAVTNVCHAQGIAHRDLKLENFVFHSETEDYPLKLVDFGSAAFFRHGQNRPFKGAAGTFNYMAPEVFESNYGPIADVWSLGVVGYSMLCGTLPFSGTTCEVLKEKILHDEVEFSHPAWGDVSECAKDLLKKMLEKNPDFRITVDEALSHAWFRQGGGGEGSNRCGGTESE